MNQDTAFRLKQLISANQALAQVESLEELLPVLLKLAQDATDAQAASILLYKPDSETLEFKLAINDDAEAAKELLSRRIELKLGEGLAGHVAQSRQALMIEDAYKDERFFGKADKASGFVTKGLLCVPIVHMNELLGVVQVLNSRTKYHFDKDDLELLDNFGHLAAVALVRSRMLAQLLQQERLQAQLDAAVRIQENFLPKPADLGPGAGVWAATKPAVFVGGDLYDLIPHGDGSWLFCVADVSGKGLPAALIGAALWTKIRTLSSVYYEPDELCAALNADMYDIFAQEMFATLALARFDPQTGRTRTALAGHLPPILVSGAAASILEGYDGMPLGIERHMTFVGREDFLQSGESFILLSDGVTEARNPKRDFLGEERVLDLLRQAPYSVRSKRLMRAALEWCGDRPANDDVTVLEFWKT